MSYSYNNGVSAIRSKSIFAAAGAMLLAGVIAVTALIQPASAAMSTVTVTESTSMAENSPGWYFDRDPRNHADYEFNTDEASIGEGSLYVKPIVATPASKFIAENFINSSLADIDSISFDFMLGADSTAADADMVYMNVYANFGDSSDTKYFDCRYDVVATIDSTTDWNTVTFDPTLAYPVAKHSTSLHECPAIPANMNLADDGSTIRMFSLNVGDTNASDVGLDAYLDNVVVATTLDTITYDFEPMLSPSNKDACKKGGWATFNTPVFKNQGQCVSSVASNKND